MFKLNRHGMGMIEVLVAGAMAAIVSLGVATMMQNSMKESRRMVILDTLKNKKILFDNMLRDPNVWTAIMNNNAAPFTTLRSTNTVTPEIAYTAPSEFKIYNADNTLAYDLLNGTDAAGPYNGFTEKGGTCTNFYANASGNDACPFSYRLLVAVDCVYGTSCMNPQLKLVARLVYNPASSGTLASFTSFINPVTGQDISDSVIDGKYDSVVKRTATSINRSFRLVSGFTPSGPGATVDANCAAALLGGAGQCTATQQNHPLPVNSGSGGTASSSATGYWSSAAAHGGYDDNTLVQANTNGTFKFTEKGFYSCNITMPAFATDGFTGYLYDSTASTVVAQASVVAGQYNQTTLNIDAKFNVNDITHAYKIQQKCDNVGTSPTNYSYCTLGIPRTGTVAGDYAGYTVIISVNCFKIDRSM